jgi:hypothetical protein
MIPDEFDYETCQKDCATYLSNASGNPPQHFEKSKC